MCHCVLITSKNEGANTVNVNSVKRTFMEALGLMDLRSAGTILGRLYNCIDLVIYILVCSQ